MPSRKPAQTHARSVEATSDATVAARGPPTAVETRSELRQLRKCAKVIGIPAEHACVPDSESPRGTLRNRRAVLLLSRKQTAILTIESALWRGDDAGRGILESVASLGNRPAFGANASRGSTLPAHETTEVAQFCDTRCSDASRMQKAPTAPTASSFRYDAQSSTQHLQSTATSLREELRGKPATSDCLAVPGTSAVALAARSARRRAETQCRDERAVPTHSGVPSQSRDRELSSQSARSREQTLTNGEPPK